jgi:hypothetical protein
MLKDSSAAFAHHRRKEVAMLRLGWSFGERQLFLQARLEYWRTTGTKNAGPVIPG